MSLFVRPIPLREANAFVSAHHRHHPPVRGCLFSVGAWRLDLGLHGVVSRLVGVAILGRPVARRLADGWTAEVTRLCTDGTRNACSKLLAALTRAAQALGLARVVSYTLPSEGGAAWRASGWRDDGPSGGGSWSRAGRPREDRAPTAVKQRWLWEVR